MSAITLPIKFGSHNAKGLIDDRYARAGIKLGCPRVSSLDSRLRPVYTIAGQREDPRSESASKLLSSLHEDAALEMQNLVALSMDLAELIDENSPFKPTDQPAGEELTLRFEFPITWSAVKLVKAYDDLMCTIHFLYCTGGLSSSDPLQTARKLRQRAGKPVRRFLTKVAKDVANVDFL